MSFELAAVDNATVEVEVDPSTLLLTLGIDGKVIVLHDSNLERLWGITKESTQMDWAEISQLGQGEDRIPLLIDAYDARLKRADERDTIQLLHDALLKAAQPASEAVPPLASSLSTPSA